MKSLDVHPCQAVTGHLYLTPPVSISVRESPVGGHDFHPPLGTSEPSLPLQYQWRRQGSLDVHCYPAVTRCSSVGWYHWRPVESQDFHHHSALTRPSLTHSVCHSPKPGWCQQRHTGEPKLLFLPSNNKEHAHTHTHTCTHTLSVSRVCVKNLDLGFYLVVTKQCAPLFTHRSSVKRGLLTCRI